MNIPVKWNRTTSFSVGFLLPLLICFYISSDAEEQVKHPQINSEKSVIEIRTYNLVSGEGENFHQFVTDEVMPLLKKWNTNLVGYGPSLHDDDSYYLIRGYQSLENRANEQDLFYSSSEWRDGPRDRILSLIETYTSVIVSMDEKAIDTLRGELIEQ